MKTNKLLSNQSYKNIYTNIIYGLFGIILLALIIMLIYYIWKSKYITDEFANRDWYIEPSFLLMRDKCKDADADVLNVILAEYNNQVYQKSNFISNNPRPPMPPTTDKSPTAERLRKEREQYDKKLEIINNTISEKKTNVNNIINKMKGNNCSKATNAYLDTRYSNNTNIFKRAVA
jgi:hypothetical protein